LSDPGTSPEVREFNPFLAGKGRLESGEYIEEGGIMNYRVSSLVGLFLLILIAVGCGEKKQETALKSKIEVVEKDVKRAVEKVKKLEKIKAMISIDIERIHEVVKEASETTALEGEAASRIAEKLKALNINTHLAFAIGELKVISLAMDSCCQDDLKILLERKGGELENLRDLLHTYKVRIPFKDPWGNPYYYKVDQEDPRRIRIASAGKDGKFEGFKEKGIQVSESSDDIILADGRFSLGPRIE
jgi:hypothetical protein